MSEAPKSAGPGAEGVYSAREVSRLFEVPESKLRYWAQTGFIRPSQRLGERTMYDFRDLIAVKVAKELLAAGISLQRVRRALDALRIKLPGVNAPLARLRIRCEHDAVIVEESDHAFEATTGQYLLNFSVSALAQEVATVLTLPLPGARRDEDEGEERSAYEHFLAGCEHQAAWEGEDEEDAAFVAARAAYERAIELDPGLAAAYTNLGSMLAAVGDLDGARDLFDEALGCDGDQPEAQANLAALAFETGDPETAIAGYRLLLRGHPDHLEAQYGLGRALLAVGKEAHALAHLERFCAGVDRLPPGEIDAELAARRDHAGMAVAALRQARGGR
jgi:DNA-binding transcriptional MerR regulator